MVGNWLRKCLWQQGRYLVIQNYLWRLARLLMKLLLRFEITNLANIPAEGPVVVIINHISIFDPVMVLGGVPRLVIPMAKKEAFDWLAIGLLLRLYGAIPVRRAEMDLDAIKSALQILKRGGAILLAPEGTRSPTGRLQAAKPGAAMLAYRSNAAIVPIGVTGTPQVMAHWLHLRRAPVQVSVGEPFRLHPTVAGPRPGRADMEAMTQEMMYRLALQLPKAFRGVYEDLEQATEFYLRPVTADCCPTSSKSDIPR